MTAMILNVRPAGSGWLLDLPLSDGPLMFASGGRAEAKAHDLARRHARLGHETCVLVQDRTEEVVGRTLYPAGLDMPSAGRG